MHPHATVIVNRFYFEQTRSGTSFIISNESISECAEWFTFCNALPRRVASHVPLASFVYRLHIWSSRLVRACNGRAITCVCSRTVDRLTERVANVAHSAAASPSTLRLPRDDAVTSSRRCCNLSASKQGVVLTKRGVSETDCFEKLPHSISICARCRSFDICEEM
jgi:hypothetical protein